MIPDGLEMMTGFLIGIVIGSTVGMLTMGVLAAGGRADAEAAAFHAGVANEQNRREREQLQDGPESWDWSRP